MYHCLQNTWCCDYVLTRQSDPSGLPCHPWYIEQWNSLLEKGTMITAFMVRTGADVGEVILEFSARMSRARVVTVNETDWKIRAMVFGKCMLHCIRVEDFCKRLKGTVRIASSESKQFQMRSKQLLKGHAFKLLSQNVLEKLGCPQTAVVEE